jgi:hypothetical protein
MKRIGVLTVGLATLVGLNFAYAGGDVVEIGGLKSKVPAGWKVQEPSNKLRMYQMSIPKVEGDKDNAELVVFFFGTGGGGGTEDNIKRWKTQFIAPEGKSIDDVSKLEKYKVGKAADVICLDISGTYKYKFPPNDPRAKEERKENYRRFNVIFDTDKGSYFITLTGPAKTMQKNKEAFDGWIKAFK